MAAAPPDLHELWVSLNRPSAARFHRALSKRGIPARLADVEAFTRAQGAKQIHAPGPTYPGRIWSRNSDDRWAADYADFQQDPDGKFRMALVVQDIFSRFLWAFPMEKAVDAAEAFAVLLHKTGRTPDELVTDADPAFQTPAFRELLENHGIHHTVKIGRNDNATVDRAIFSIKRALAEHRAATGQAGWAHRLPEVVKGLNASESAYPNGAAPDDVKPANKVLTFDLLWKNAHFMQHNADLIHKRAAVLEREGAFRHLLPARNNLGRRRVFHATWSHELHPVKQVRLGTVEDEAGATYPTKEVLAVPKDSSEAIAVAAPAGGAVLNQKRRAALQGFADRAVAWLRAQPERTATVTKLSLELLRSGDFRKAAQLAGISLKNTVAGFLATFPDRFVMHTGRAGGAATVRLL
jgi:hypothetical protein